MLPRQRVAEQEVKDCRLLLPDLRVWPSNLLVAGVRFEPNPLHYELLAQIDTLRR
jgi:hypothetical protein